MNTKKIILIQPPLGRGMTKELFQPIFPYGLAHVATSLAQKGHDVQIFDIYANRWNRTEVMDRIKHFEADFIGITAMSTQYSYVKWLSEQLKHVLSVPIVVGGLLATYSSHIVLKHTHVDVCVIGEGELTFPELVESGDDYNTVNGIVYRQGDEIVRTPPREYIQSLDTIPVPDYDIFPMDIYTKTKFYVNDPTTSFFKGAVSTRTMGVLAGRGCPYNCEFCSKSFTGLRLKSVDYLIDEIKYLIAKYDLQGIHFIDELFVVNKKRAYELIEKIGKLGIQWDAQARVNTVDYELLKAMKDAGCIAIGYGIESGSNTILKKMNKRITTEQSIQAMDAARRAGLHVKVQLVLGFPGETEQTIQETVAFFDQIKHPARRFSLILPLPGSALYNQAIRDNLITDEEYYLSQIYDGYGAARYPVFVNFTQLPTEQLYRLKANAEKQMQRNYQRYLSKNPAQYLNYWRTNTLRHSYRFIARYKKFMDDPKYYSKKILQRILN